MDNTHPPVVSFSDTKIAFQSKSDADLTRAYWLFKVINNNFLVKIGPPLTRFAISVHIPISSMIKATIFRHFCGGESISDSEHTVTQLGKYNVGTILDYSAEGEQQEEAFEATALEIIRTIQRARHDKNIPFSVFKPTGLSRFALLEKLDRGERLSINEQAEYNRVIERFDKICKAAFDADVRIFIDAEESWIQNTIDHLVLEMMLKYNQKKIIIYNTYQMYRWESLDHIKEHHQKIVSAGAGFGAKLVRGAYMEKERKRAEEMGYPSPIQVNKAATDKDYNEALKYCIDHLDTIAFCAGTHNEESSRYLMGLMAEKNIALNHEHVYFSQLLGMSDNLSFNLANAGYNVAKYVPYGPVKSVLPYLFRRAEENTAIAGQMGRELNLIIQERRRRKGSRK